MVGLSLQCGEAIPTTMEVKTKLSDAWNISNFKVIPSGKGLFHILLHNVSDQCTTFALGTIFFKSGLMQFNKWTSGLNVTQTQSLTQI